MWPQFQAVVCLGGEGQSRGPAKIMREIITYPRGQIFRDKHTSPISNSVVCVASIVHPVFQPRNTLPECKENGNDELIQRFIPFTVWTQGEKKNTPANMSSTLH